MASMPSVSVVIPCRNGERYLAATLESALAQSSPAAEIIVVDDGSTDGSRSVAEGFGPAVSVVSNPGHGASAARTYASRLARGEFLQYLDADDLLLPEALATRVACLTSEAADIAIGDWQRLEERGGVWIAGASESGDLASRKPPLDLRIFEGFWAPPAAILYRRTVFDALERWPESRPIIQDARFLFDAVRLGGRVVHVAGLGASYRQHATGSLSTGSAARFWADVFENAREVEQIWDEAREVTDGHRRALADVYSLCARMSVTDDPALFERSCAELRRFSSHDDSRFGRAATLLSAWFGAGVARAILKTLHGQKTTPA